MTVVLQTHLRILALEHGYRGIFNDPHNYTVY